MRTERKLGLALSGGGFRASFFHIGVLARLAELDLLRPIEVISTVSGGSIIGALYYLHLKQLLGATPDRRITPQAYVDLVSVIEDEFLKSVQWNLRTRAYADFKKNWRMIASQKFSRSDRMAELYDEFIYDAVAPTPRVSLDELTIQPPEGPKRFHPRRHNVSRRAKVPILIINATTLNSGRNWQFSAVDAGEHEPDTEEERARSDQNDKSVLFQAFRYDDSSLPTKYKHIPLSVAVAASACVPGIFPPLALTGLYPHATPKLVDGGVYDNQGISALLYERCTDLVISDASGQMENERKPGSGIFSVLPRANSMLMDRVRDSGFSLLDHLIEGKQLQSYVNLHLKDDFVVDKLNAGQSMKDPDELVPARTSYGIHGRVQQRLAAIRTDLDSFTEVEARSLMLSGYAIGHRRLPRTLQSAFRSKAKFAGSPGPRNRSRWRFDSVRQFAEAPKPDEDYLHQLKVGSERMFKAYRLGGRWIPLGIIIALVGFLVPAALLAALWYLISTFSLWDIVLAAGLLLLVGAVAAAGVSTRWLKHLWEEFILLYIVTATVALFGSVVARLHLAWIDPKYLEYGRIDHLIHRTRH